MKPPVLQMARTLIAVLCLTVIVTMLGFIAGCEEGRGSIQGTVYDEDGTPGANLVIRAGRPGDPMVLLRSDEDGAYRISNVYVGEWSIEFYDKAGWLVGLETVTVKANETVTLDFTIGAKPLPDGVVPGRILNAP